MKELLLKATDKELRKMFPEEVKSIFNSNLIFRERGTFNSVFATLKYYSGANVILEVQYEDQIKKEERIIYPDDFSYQWEPVTYKIATQLRSKFIQQNLLPNTSEKLEKVIKQQLHQLYGEERVYTKIVSDNKVNVIVHYPAIKITNSIGSEHTMKDVYLEILFRLYPEYSGIKIIDYGMYRTTFQDYEILPDGRFYMFSHLSASDDPRYRRNKLCFGNRNQISSTFDTFTGSYTNSYKNIGAFFLMMESYFSWESIEGTPYCHMPNNSSLLSFSSNNYKLTPDMYKILVNNIDYGMLDFSLCPEINYDHKIAYITDNSYDYIKNLLEDLFPDIDENKIYWSYLSEMGTPVQQDSTQLRVRKDLINEYNGRKSNLSFKGVQQYITIEDNTNKIITLGRGFHTDVIRAVINRLELDLTEFIILNRIK